MDKLINSIRTNALIEIVMFAGLVVYFLVMTIYLLAIAALHPGKALIAVCIALGILSAVDGNPVYDLARDLRAKFNARNTKE